MNESGDLAARRTFAASSVGSRVPAIHGPGERERRHLLADTLPAREQIGMRKGLVRKSPFEYRDGPVMTD
jgi:hypothetical protein